MWQTYLTVALVAYLLGSIPFGYILVKLFLKQDIRTTGSGNIGATNVARSGKKGLAIATLLLDAGKGYLAVWLCWKYQGAPAGFVGVTAFDDLRYASNLLALAALFAVIGHMFPAYLKFSGGKGVATAVGAFLFIAPKSVGVALVVFALTFIATRFVSLSSTTASLAFAVSSLFPQMTLVHLQSAPLFHGFLMTTAALVIFKHHSNIRRLLNGTEPKFGVKKPIPADPIQVEKNA